MRRSALLPYEHALRTGTPLQLHRVDVHGRAAGAPIGLDIDRYLGPIDDVDADVVARCDGPVLDVGCGPGRFVTALSATGVPALGVDIAARAVALTRAEGGPALVRDVFDDLPGEGRWPTILLMDGNIGIGGDPSRLLARVRTLLAPCGRVIVETHADPDTDESAEVRFGRCGITVGPTFDWALVGARSLSRHARAVRLAAVESWSASGRHFACLRTER